MSSITLILNKFLEFLEFHNFYVIVVSETIATTFSYSALEGQKKIVKSVQGNA